MTWITDNPKRKTRPKSKSLTATPKQKTTTATEDPAKTCEELNNNSSSPTNKSPQRKRQRMTTKSTTERKTSTKKVTKYQKNNSKTTNADKRKKKNATASAKNNNTDDYLHFKADILQERKKLEEIFEEQRCFLQTKIGEQEKKVQDLKKDEEEDQVSCNFMTQQKLRHLIEEHDSLQSQLDHLDSKKKLEEFDEKIKPKLLKYNEEQLLKINQKNAMMTMSQCGYNDYYQNKSKVEEDNVSQAKNTESINQNQSSNAADSKESQLELICPTCEVPLISIVSLSCVVCPKCGLKESHIDATLMFTRDHDNTFHYKRINHLNESLLLFQAKEGTTIPCTITEEIMVRLFQSENHLNNPETITLLEVRDALRSIGHRKYYENEAQITYLITGKPPPSLTSYQESRIRARFYAIQAPFRQFRPPDRKNFFSYHYLCFKFCDIENWNEFLPLFRLHKGAEKRRYLDKIWKKICEDLDKKDPTMPWPYRDSPMPTPLDK